MTDLHIQLEEDLKRRLVERASENGFKTVEAYVQSLLESDAGIESEVDPELEKLLIERLGGASGVELTHQAIQTFKSEVADRRLRGAGREPR